MQKQVVCLKIMEKNVVSVQESGYYVVAWVQP